MIGQMREKEEKGEEVVREGGEKNNVANKSQKRTFNKTKPLGQKQLQPIHSNSLKQNLNSSKPHLIFSYSSKNQQDQGNKASALENNQLEMFHPSKTSLGTKVRDRRALIITSDSSNLHCFLTKNSAPTHHKTTTTKTTPTTTTKTSPAITSSMTINNNNGSTSKKTKMDDKMAEKCREFIKFKAQQTLTPESTNQNRDAGMDRRMDEVGINKGRTNESKKYLGMRDKVSLDRMDKDNKNEERMDRRNDLSVDNLDEILKDESSIPSSQCSHDQHCLLHLFFIFKIELSQK